MRREIQQRIKAAPAAPVRKRRDCVISWRLAANCDTCGVRNDDAPLHLPMKIIGLYCPACCPVCGGDK